MANSIITLTTDFSWQDGFVGAMKGVMLSINPNLNIIDLAHNLPRQEVFVGAMLLRNVCKFYPKGSIHVVVIDPGVGSNRKAIVAVADNATFVVPDNGLLSFVNQTMPIREIYSIENPALQMEKISPTFHGRDVFAPVAAHLSLGKLAQEVGPPLKQFYSFPFPEPKVSGDRIEGEITFVDTYGNLITNIEEKLFRSWGTDCILRIGGREIAGLSETFANANEGSPLFYAGSSGFLEVAINKGDAATAFEVTQGTKVVLNHGI